MAENLFLVPYDYPNFRRTVVDGIEVDESDYPDGFPTPTTEADVLRVWGVRDGERNRTYFDQMNPGDGLLFYNQGAYRFAGSVGETFEHSWVANRFWGGAPSEMLYTVENFTRIQLPRGRLNDLLGYKKSSYPQGLQRVSDKKMNNLGQHYGSFGALFEKFTSKR